MEDTTSPFHFIHQTYDELTYFDLYGQSVLLFLGLSVALCVVVVFCHLLRTKEEIARDWVNQRCKLQNMLFAGFISRPEGTSIFDATSANFQYCVQSILHDGAGYSLQPFQYMLDALTAVFTQMAAAMQETRGAIDRLRTGVQSFATDVLSRILNMVIPLQKLMISVKDTFQKIQGTMTASLFTMLGTYNVLQSLMGAILELVIKVLTVLVVIIVGLWVMPFTWPAAASMSAVFASIAIPLSVIVYFMTEVLHIQSSAIPKLRCFAWNTPVPLGDGRTIPMCKVCVGDTLQDGNRVTGTFLVTSDGLTMYRLGGVVVSGTHLVLYRGRWVRVEEHPESEVCDTSYDVPVVYCLTTSSKRFQLADVAFVWSDWDEWFPESTPATTTTTNNSKKTTIDVEGWPADTEVSLSNGQTKAMGQLRVGDRLARGGSVYGLVRLNNKRCHVLSTRGHLSLGDGRIVSDYNEEVDRKIII